MAHDHAVTTGLKHRSALVWALLINAGFMVVEGVAGFITGSLVLIADAGHMLTDVAGVSAALFAIWIAQRPANQRKTYGYYRTEILAALGNALLLFGVSAYIFYEAYQRWEDPPEVPGFAVLAVAVVGLIANLIGARLLARGAGEDLNVCGAFLDMVADVFGSLGAIAAAIVILTTGWRYADPLFAAAVAVVILPRTWRLLKGAVDVLLEGTPSHVDLQEVQAEIQRQPDVQSVHDLHVWTVTSGFVALSGHVLVQDEADRDALLVGLRKVLAQRFDIEHVTIQVENERLSAELEQPCFPEAAPWDGRDTVLRQHA
jgi:cobalt-zinc-cadmium efflux system protein